MSTIDALADVRAEGDTDPFASLGETTQSDSPAEKEQGEVKPDQGKNTDEDLTTPFHRHPRWIERENEFKTLRERNETQERELADLKQFKEQTSQKLSSFDKKSTQIPDWFVTLYGDNLEAYEKYNEHTQQERETMKQEAREAYRQEVAQAQAQEQHWINWVEGEFNKLETKGYKFDREELKTVILKTRPTDENGNIDFEAGYETYVARKGPAVDPQKSLARKQVADSVMKSSRGEPTKKDYKTSHDLRNRKWSDIGN